jgi:hypothetical protein
MCESDNRFTCRQFEFTEVKLKLFFASDENFSIKVEFFLSKIAPLNDFD